MIDYLFSSSTAQSGGQALGFIVSFLLNLTMYGFIYSIFFKKFESSSTISDCLCLSTNISFYKSLYIYLGLRSQMSINKL